MVDEFQWKKIFYRLVDSYDQDETKRKRLLEAENNVFQNIKKVVENDTGLWSGSQLQNRLADYKVASAIYSSFKTYETKGLQRRGTFFNFKKK